MSAHENEIFDLTAVVSDSRIRGSRFTDLARLAAGVVLYLALPVYAAAGQYIANNAPPYVASAKNLGPASASQTIDVSIWLQPHNRVELDALARELYDPTSPQYRHWLKRSAIAAQFAPTAAEAKTVQDFFSSNGLKIVSVGPDNFYVKARGTVQEVQKAFHVKLNNYQVGDRVLRANATNPYVAGPAAALVQAISGLDSAAFEHPVKLASDILASNSTPPTNLSGFSRASTAVDSTSFDTVCFPGPETLNYRPSATYPTATYSGNAYATGANGSVGCGYSPANIYEAYNLNALYAEGYDGAGQTIVIIEWCGSPTIKADANAFSKRFGLPQLTSANFSIINYPSQSACVEVNAAVNADVEWAHAIAPGAKIALIVPFTQYVEDIDEATYYAITSGLGNVVSGGNTLIEFFVPGTELNKENLISEIAAVAGVATNYASGDSGSYGDLGFLPQSVSVPATLPYATAVGGVSLALNANNSIQFQTGWETNVTVLNQSGIISDPPHNLTYGGFVQGSGGGSSGFFAKPWFQKGVTGNYRQVPDISWLADPLTGAVIAISQPGQLPLQVWYSVGGTGLATSMFSALWAIANQEAGTALGQAAPYLYSMPATTITDIVQHTSTHNVTAVIRESSSVVNRYNAAETLTLDAYTEPFFGPFYSAIWNEPNGQGELVVSFSGNRALKEAVGWDDVTGLGTPNAKAFADWFSPNAPSSPSKPH